MNQWDAILAVFQQAPAKDIAQLALFVATALEAKCPDAVTINGTHITFDLAVANAA